MSSDEWCYVWSFKDGSPHISGGWDSEKAAMGAAEGVSRGDGVVIMRICKTMDLVRSIYNLGGRPSAPSHHDRRSSTNAVGIYNVSAPPADAGAGGEGEAIRLVQGLIADCNEAGRNETVVTREELNRLRTLLAAAERGAAKETWFVEYQNENVKGCTSGHATREDAEIVAKERQLKGMTTVLICIRKATAANPGAATRKVMELLATCGINGLARELRCRMAVDLESGDTALHPEHEALIAAALAECEIPENPR